MASIGEELAEARVAKELTPKDVERYIKIRAKYISSMEADDFNDIPGQAYVLGFLKSYADFLGLDGASVIKRYREEQSAGAEAHSKSAQYADSIPLSVERPRPERSLVLLLFMIALIAAGWFGYALLYGTNKTGTKAEKKTPPKTAPAAAAGQFTITVRVIKPGGTQLFIDTDGNRTFEGALEKGERSWTAGSEIRVEAKNAQAVEIIRDGGSRGPLGPAPAAASKIYKKDDHN